MCAVGFLSAIERLLNPIRGNICDDLLFGSGECLVCSLKLCEQISTSNQGLLMFECGK